MKTQKTDIRHFMTNTRLFAAFAVLFLLTLCGHVSANAGAEPIGTDAHAVADTLINDVPTHFTPTANDFFVLPSETCVAPPPQTSRVTGRSNTFSANNIGGSNKSPAHFPQYVSQSVFRKSRLLRYASFARPADYYVYFLSFLRL